MFFMSRKWRKDQYGRRKSNPYSERTMSLEYTELHSLILGKLRLEKELRPREFAKAINEIHSRGRKIEKRVLNQNGFINKCCCKIAGPTASSVAGVLIAAVVAAAIVYPVYEVETKDNLTHHEFAFVGMIICGATVVTTLGTLCCGFIGNFFHHFKGE